MRGLGGDRQNGLLPENFRYAEAIQLLPDAGAHIEAKDAHGDTPLSWASWYLRPRAILRMLCYGGYSVRA